MKQIVYSVFDDKAGVYGTPIFVNSQGIAVRSFSDAVKESGSVFARHASDYKLYRIGEFDNVSGELIKLDAPLFVVHASDFVDQKEA